MVIGEFEIRVLRVCFVGYSMGSTETTLLLVVCGMDLDGRA